MVAFVADSTWLQYHNFHCLFLPGKGKYTKIETEAKDLEALVASTVPQVTCFLMCICCEVSRCCNAYFKLF